MQKQFLKANRLYNQIMHGSMIYVHAKIFSTVNMNQNCLRY